MTEAWQPNGDEEVDLRLYKAVREGMLTPVPCPNCGEMEYVVTEVGRIRAKVLARNYDGLDPDALDEAQEIALVASLMDAPPI